MDDRRQTRRERPRGVMQFAERDGGFLGAAIGQENIGPIVGLGGSAPFKQRYERGKRFHLRRRQVASG